MEDIVLSTKEKIITSVIAIALFLAIAGGIGLLAVNFSSPYRVHLVDISSGSPPIAELEIYARVEGPANIKIWLLRAGKISATGEFDLKMASKQTERAAIPLHIRDGQPVFMGKEGYGKEASFDSIEINLNGKKVDWKRLNHE